ncbi:hypothetical protein FF36_02277 [Frankia torreyi]|uniref:Uncharacterized protein n=1 Tax=Frankia torreyi TaxID=1856 RepID=A0A0D8BH76_9ACTN|nr:MULTISPECIES: hypothetical protein [Frankia]KJE23319.1 hypothetical protein FF36_02277 [Frankia torreyi]
MPGQRDDVKITGLALALLDIPARYTQEYNRWYDLDHLPEHVAKADVVAGRRYVATPATRATPGALAGELTHGHPPYATMYLFGGPLDFMSEQAFAGWRDTDRAITRAGRFWRHGRPVFTSWWRLTAAHTRPSIDVAADAVPHLAHQGVVVSIGRAGPGGRPAALDWWERTQRDDLYELPGLLGTLQLEPVETGEQDLVLHVLLCAQPAAEVLAGLTAVRDRQRLTGRFPAHGGAHETLALLPYERIIPLQYDFDMGEPTEPTETSEPTETTETTPAGRP